MSRALGRALVLSLLSLSAAASAAESFDAGTQPFVLIGGTSRFAPQLLEDLRAGLARLPPGARNFPGGPLEIELHDAAGPWGMGDETSAHPQWTNGQRRFHLYAFEPVDDRRAMIRLTRLSASELEHLWRQRAIVHAVVARWNAHYRWSSRLSWRQLNGWIEGQERLFSFKESSLNVYPGAFSRALGMQSSALDLATFAEELYVPAESVREDALVADERLACQEFAKARFLTGLVNSVAGLHTQWERPTCPAFSQWARLDTLDHFEVLFSAPSGAHAESIFGHVFLRPVHRMGELAYSTNAEQVLEIAAITDMQQALLPYLWKGMTGKYQTVFSLNDLGTVLKTNVEKDQRNLKRFWLHFTPSEQERLMERIWEVERRGYLAYYFLNENCASDLIWLLNGVLDTRTQIERPGSFWVMPTATLDAMAHVELDRPRTDGHGFYREPLLTYLPGDFLSHRQLALDAELARTKGLDTVLQLAPSSLRASWQRVTTELSTPNSVQRRSAYEALAQLATRTLVEEPHDETLRRAIYEYFRNTQTAERFIADQADAHHEFVRRRALLLPRGLKLPTADEQLAVRQREYEHEDAPARARASEMRTLQFEEMMSGLPSRPLSAGEKAQLATDVETTQVFARLNELVGDLNERFFSAYLDDEAAQNVDRVAIRSPPRDVLPGSGYGRSSVGLSLDNPSGQRPYPTLTLRSAVVSEYVGDQRQRGFGPENEVHLLDSETQLRWNSQDSSVQFVRFDSQALRYRTLGRPPLSNRSHFQDWVGWEVGVDFTYERLPIFLLGAHLDGVLWAILDNTPSYRRFLALGIGPALEPSLNLHHEVSLSLGPELKLAERIPLPGHTANCLRIEATDTPQFRMAGPGRLGSLVNYIKVSGELELLLSQNDTRAWLARPRVTFAYQKDGPNVIQQLDFSLVGEWL